MTQNKLMIVLNKKSNLMNAVNALENRIKLWQNRDREVESSLRAELEPLNNEVMNMMLLENEIRLEMMKGSV